MLEIYLNVVYCFHSGDSGSFLNATLQWFLLHLFYIKANQSFWHHNGLWGNERGIASKGKTSEKIKKRTSFPSNLLHHVPKIQWIRLCTPELTITAETIGAWNISYHLHFISAIHAKHSRSGSLKWMPYRSGFYKRAGDIYLLEISAF